MEYKLIKTYPGSPKLGTISEPNDFKVIAPHLDTNNVDNYREYWEKVRERDYEILMMMNPNIRTPSTPYRIQSISQSNCIARYANGHVIHSVKRLSDGIIFTVEDRIDISERLYKNNIIRGFNIGSDGKVLVSINDGVDRSYKESKGCCIFIIEHSKKLFLTTEDGVDIFEGDEFWFDRGEGVPKYFNPKVQSYQKLYKKYKTFSTQEKAEEYILMNNPCLSINDIFSNSNLEEDGVIWHGLRDLVKTRL